MTLFSPTAVERAMKIQEVILKAIGGELKWYQAAKIIGCSERTMRRCKARYEKNGYDGLFDRRLQRPSPKRAPIDQVEKILHLYRTKYFGFNIRHFHQIIKKNHDVKLSYSFVKAVLQGAGLVAKKNSRGRHRRRRERKSCFGEMLQIDGSTHEWLALCPGEKQTMIVIVDDATSKMLYAQLFLSESAEAIFTALRTVIEEYGIPMSLYSDRAAWAFFTPKGSKKVDKDNLTQVGRALNRLGIEHIPSYSPQGRGRSERLNRTLQDRVVNEFKAAGIKDVAKANNYLKQKYQPTHNENFAVLARELESMFVSSGIVDLNEILCEQHERVVGQDNVVRYKKLLLQISKQKGRSTFARRQVLVREHTNETISIWFGVKRLGIYDSQGRELKPKVKLKEMAS